MTREYYLALISYAIEKKCSEKGGQIPVAQELNISRQTLSNWKAGKCEIPAWIAIDYFGFNQIESEYEHSIQVLTKKILESIPEELKQQINAQGYKIEVTKIKPECKRKNNAQKIEQPN